MGQKQIKKARKAAKAERDWTAERDVRCMPVVMEIFKAIAEMPEAPINTESLAMTKEKCYDIYFAVNKRINEVISKANIDILSDMEFIWSCVREIGGMTERIVTESIKTNDSVLNDAIFGVKEGEPSLYKAQDLAKLVSKKDKVRVAMQAILDEPDEKADNKEA